ncbi:MAG: MFS transporter [Ectothiorhodospiraceae bacterium]|nr:MFS transporter [Ectothiorhodospiraceae bacterium]
MSDKRKAYQVLTMNTIAFTVCFAVWMMNGVLVTFLVENGVFHWDKAEIGILIGIPVLTGSIMRLPVGVLTDKYGGKIIYTAVMVLSALPMFLMSAATEYWHFVLASLGFGLAGASFAVGIAYTSVWFSKERQGTALGIFGAGNAGAALTSLGAPWLLQYLTDGGKTLDAWRTMPIIYAIVLLAMAAIFFFTTYSKRTEHGRGMTLRQRLAPLKYVRVWRFGLYYFLVFGGFVALAQWLIPYYVNAYTMSIATAGLMASIFSLPSGVIRALGGWLSDKYGARQVMYWVFGTCLLCFIFLCVPRMEITSPGQGIMAEKSGVVEEVSDEAIVVSGREYPLRHESLDRPEESDVLVFPTFAFQQVPLVEVGDHVSKRELLAKGDTQIFFQANVWIFTVLVFIVGILMGIGKAGVYKFIPEYYPQEVGVVGGIVGVLGGLGGFFCPIIFGYLLQSTGIWTTAWMFLFLVTIVSHLWMHSVVRRMMRQNAPTLSRQIEDMDGTDSEAVV